MLFCVSQYWSHNPYAGAFSCIFICNIHGYLSVFSFRSSIELLCLKVVEIVMEKF